MTNTSIVSICLPQAAGVVKPEGWHRAVGEPVARPQKFRGETMTRPAFNPADPGGGDVQAEFFRFQRSPRMPPIPRLSIQIAAGSGTAVKVTLSNRGVSKLLLVTVTTKLLISNPAKLSASKVVGVSNAEGTSKESAATSVAPRYPSTVTAASDPPKPGLSRGR